MPSAAALRHQLGAIRPVRQRQLVIYLAHTELGLRFAALAQLFQRSPGTMRHACARVEDRREEPAFDRLVDTLATLFRALLPTPALLKLALPTSAGRQTCPIL